MFERFRGHSRGVAQFRCKHHPQPFLSTGHRSTRSLNGVPWGKCNWNALCVCVCRLEGACSTLAQIKVHRRLISEKRIVVCSSHSNCACTAVFDCHGYYIVLFDCARVLAPKGESSWWVGMTAKAFFASCWRLHYVVHACTREGDVKGWACWTILLYRLKYKYIGQVGLILPNWTLYVYWRSMVTKCYDRFLSQYCSDRWLRAREHVSEKEK